MKRERGRASLRNTRSMTDAIQFSGLDAAAIHVIETSRASCSGKRMGREPIGDDRLASFHPGERISCVSRSKKPSDGCHRRVESDGSDVRNVPDGKGCGSPWQSDSSYTDLLPEVAR